MFLLLKNQYYARIDYTGGFKTGDVVTFKTTGCVVGEGALYDDLVSYYKLDSSSGTSAVDSHGSNTGTVSGATWTTGKINNGLSFNDSTIVLGVSLIISGMPFCIVILSSSLKVEDICANSIAESIFVFVQENIAPHL